MTGLLILGAGGHAKVVAETALASGTASSVSFLDDSPTTTSLGFPVLGPLSLSLDSSLSLRFSNACVALGDSVTRLLWINRLLDSGYCLPTIIHPTSWISPSASIDKGSVVFAHAVIQSECSIGTGSIINTSCSVDHNSFLSSGVHISPGARLAGSVSVGFRSWIGIGASVIQQIQIGSDVTVGAGAVVTRDLPDSVTAVGVPARYS